MLSCSSNSGRRAVFGALVLAASCGSPPPDAVDTSPPPDAVPCPPPSEGASACIDTSALPVCTVDGWCWVDPLPQGQPITGLHALAADDAWLAAGVVLHWDGASETLAFGDPSSSTFASVFEAAPNEVWAASLDGPVVRYRDGILQTMLTTGASAITGTGPSDVWIAGTTVSHWDGSALSDTMLPPSSSQAVAICTAGGSTWALGSTQVPNFLPINSLYQFSGGTWTNVPTGYDPGAIAAFGGNDLWLALGNEVGPLGGPLLTSDRPLDDFSLLGGSSDTDVWVAGNAMSTPSLLHSNGTELDRVAYSGASYPTALWIDRSSAFLGDSRGQLLTLCGGTSVAVTPQPLPSTAFTGYQALWGSGPDDVYFVGSEYSYDYTSPGFVGSIAHWDGCRWSPFDPGLGALLPAQAVWAMDDDVWITGEPLGIGPGIPYLLHKDAAGWHQLPTPSNNTYGSIWGSATNDVWFGGATFMHWDGTNLTTLPPPSGLPPSPEITSLTGTATDDIWAVEPGIPDTLYHYDGSMWSQRPTPNGGFNVVWAVAPDDVWGAGFSGIFHYDGTQWSLVDSGGAFAIWGNGPKDIWFSESLHWDGTKISAIAGLGDGQTMWGDGQRVWSADEEGIHVH
jgi:hypothetical protein